jgi:hypothetical protein
MFKCHSTFCLFISLLRRVKGEQRVVIRVNGSHVVVRVDSSISILYIDFISSTRRLRERLLKVGLSPELSGDNPLCRTKTRIFLRAFGTIKIFKVLHRRRDSVLRNVNSVVVESGLCICT